MRNLSFCSTLCGLASLMLTTSAFGVLLNSDGSPVSTDPSLRLWLDSTNTSSLFSDTAGTTNVTHGGTVARWNDQSSFGHHVTNNDVGERPRFEQSVPGLGGGPAVNFTGGTTLLERANDIGVSGNGDRTVITVWQNLKFNGANYQHTFHMGNSNGNEAYGHSASRGGGEGSPIGNHYWGAGFDSTATASLDGRFAISIWDGDGGTGANGRDSWFVDGVAVGSSDRAALATATNQLYLGSRLAGPSEGITGYIAETIVYNTTLTPSELASLTNYLSTKYAYTNLLQNGSFEGAIASGDKNSGTSIGAWTVGDPDGLGANAADQVFLRDNDASRSHSGTDSITFYGGTRELHELFQEFETEAGALYEVTFYTRDRDAGLGQGLAVSVFDGTLPDSAAGAGFQTSVGLTPIEGLLIDEIDNTQYELYSFTFRAQSTTSTLVFFGNNTNGPEIDIDNVGVSFLAGAIPEPATASLAIMGLAGLLMRRRRVA